MHATFTCRKRRIHIVLEFEKKMIKKGNEEIEREKKNTHRGDFSSMLSAPERDDHGQFLMPSLIALFFFLLSSGVAEITLCSPSRTIYSSLCAGFFLWGLNVKVAFKKLYPFIYSFFYLLYLINFRIFFLVIS